MLLRNFGAGKRKKINMIFRDTEQFAPIDGFPGYEISNHGRVFNVHRGKEMVLSPTMNGDLTVGLTRGGRQYRFSVKGLVAREFVEGETEEFNTPCLLDGDKYNLYYKNIVWRPRWFAWKYSRQFSHPESWYTLGPLYEITDGVVYENYLDAAIKNGILCSYIRQSIYNETAVFPTNQMFVYPK
jgi:hypothetical protein